MLLTLQESDLSKEEQSLPKAITHPPPFARSPRESPPFSPREKGRG